MLLLISSDSALRLDTRGAMKAVFLTLLADLEFVRNFDSTWFYSEFVPIQGERAGPEVGGEIRGERRLHKFG